MINTIKWQPSESRLPMRSIKQGQEAGALWVPIIFMGVMTFLLGFGLTLRPAILLFSGKLSHIDPRSAVLGLGFLCSWGSWEDQSLTI